MADFTRALPYVLRNEGGKCDLKGDTGGRTNAGVSTPALLDFNRRHPDFGFPSDPWDMTPEQIATFYHVGYWRFNGLRDQACATKILDMDVNDGLPSGILLAQRAAVSLGAQIAADGHYGPTTEAALNACDPNRLMDALIHMSVDHYNAICAKHPEDEQFLRNWLARAGRIPNA